MTGSVSIRIKDSHSSYSFELKRNITILCGDSGKGKTTLYEMIADYNRYGKSSSVKLTCNRNVLAVDGTDWMGKIQSAKESVIVIDEDNRFIGSRDFAEAVKNSDNYYLLITRRRQEQLPVSVTEIYELTGSINKKFKKVYRDVDHIEND